MLHPRSYYHLGATGPHRRPGLHCRRRRKFRLAQEEGSGTFVTDRVPVGRTPERGPRKVFRSRDHPGIVGTGGDGHPRQRGDRHRCGNAESDSSFVGKSSNEKVLMKEVHRLKIFSEKCPYEKHLNE